MTTDHRLASHTVDWWPVHLYVLPLLTEVGSWPMAGTLTWQRLPSADPAKLAAFLAPQGITHCGSTPHRLRSPRRATRSLGPPTGRRSHVTSGGATRSTSRARGPMPDIPYGRDYDEDSSVVPWLDERPLFPPPSAPLDVVHRLYAEHRERRAGTLVCWRGGWMKWHGTHWSEIGPRAELRSRIYDVLGDVAYEVEVSDHGTITWERRPWNPDKRKVANVIEAMAAIGHLSADIDPPSWIGPHSAAETPAAQMISCKNGLLDLSGRKIVDHTPTLFNVVEVPFDYILDTRPPRSRGLTSWPRSGRTTRTRSPLLQEFIGYVLSGRTDMQKLLPADRAYPLRVKAPSPGC